MATDEYEAGESIRSLDHNKSVKARNGWSVVDKRDGSCKVEIASGTLGTGNGALEVTAGTAITSGTATNVATQPVDIDEGGPDDPRKDVVSIDAAGTAQVHKGAAKPQDPTTVTLENAEQPAPPSLNGVNATPLSMVTVPAGATSITSGNLADKRERADREFGHVRSQSSTTEQIHTNSRTAEVVIHKDDSGATVVDGPDGEISFSGDICDAIKAAENAAPADGWHIHVAAGLYGVTGTYSDGDQYVAEKPVTLSGAGWATHFRAEDNTTASDEGISIFRAAAAGVTFRDFRIDGNQQNNGGEGDGHTITYSTDGHNIRVGSNTGGGDDFTMRGVYSVNSTGDGVEPTQSEDGTIVNCRFIDSYEHNIHFNGCKRTVATGCVLSGGYQQGQVRTFTQTGAVTRDNTLSDSIISGGSTDGVRLGSGDGSLVDFTLDNVTIVNVPGDCVKITDDPAAVDALPDGIYIQNCMMKGGSVGVNNLVGSNVRVKNNEITEMDSHGIQNDPGGFAADQTDVLYEGNVVTDCGQASSSYGILSRNRGQIITELRLRENEVKAGSGALDNGIWTKQDTGTYTDCFADGNHITGTTNAARNGYGNIGQYRGMATFSGDGATTVFTVTHGLGMAAIPTSAQPDLSTAATEITGYQNVVSGSFDVVFASAPASGTDNVDVSWEVAEPV